VIALTVISAALSAGGQTYLIDFGAAGTPTTFGPAPGDPNFYWNNIGDIAFSSAGQLTNLVSTENTPSDIDIIMIDRFNGVNEAGTTASSLYPSNATRDSLYGNTEAFNGLTSVFPKFKLAGLDATTTYQLTFYASRTGVSDVRETGYTVEGATSDFVALDAANNVEGTVTVYDMKPTAAGEITISIAPTEANNNGNHFTYLGVLRVDAIPPQTPIGFTLQPASQRVAVFQPVTFTAAVTGAYPYTIQWYQDGNAIPGANALTYNIPSATLDLNGAIFAVSVSNLVYGATSTNATLTVVTDNTAPTITSAQSVSGLNVEVLFSESLEPSMAAEPYFYAVNGQTVTSATLLADGKTVFLALAEPISGEFTVTVNNVQDLAGNTIADNSTVSGNVLAIEPESFLFDFGGANTTVNGPAPDDITNAWNNVTSSIGGSDTGEIMNLVTSRNRVTDSGFVILSRFNGANENGVLTGGPFPSDATRDSLFGNTEVFSGLSNIFPSFKLTGLTPTQAYSFSFYASRSAVSDNRSTLYTVSGATTGTATLNAAANTTNIATVSGIKPSIDGEITVSLTPSASNNNANHFTYLGVMKVLPTSVPLKFTSARMANNQILLEWTGSGQLEWTSALDGTWNAVTPAPSGNSYSETLVNGQNRFFRLKQ
jgi:hypothetical protein